MTGVGWPPECRTSIERILRLVAASFAVSYGDLLSKRRSAAVALPRQIAMALAMEHTPHSSGVIGRHCGGRDHSTVLYAAGRVASLRQADRALDCQVRAIEEMLRPKPEPEPVQLAFLHGPLFDAARLPA